MPTKAQLESELADVKGELEALKRVMDRTHRPMTQDDIPEITKGLIRSTKPIPTEGIALVRWEDIAEVRRCIEEIKELPSPDTEPSPEAVQAVRHVIKTDLGMESTNTAIAAIRAYLRVMNG